MADVDVRVWSHLKEELAWSAGKRLQVISTIMLFKNSKTPKELTVSNLKQYCIRCYVAFSNVF